MAAWFRRLRARLRYRRFDRDLRLELDAHRAMTEDDLTAAGMSRAEARARAARAVGNTTLAREDARHVWIASWLESVWQDLHHGARSLRRSPAFSVIALLALTVGIGLNVSFFSLANGLFLRPWPVPDPDRVVTVYSPSAVSSTSASTSPVEYRFLRDAARTVDLVAIEHRRVRVGTTGTARLAEARLVSGNYFDVLRVPVVLGRGFVAREDEAGRPSAVAIIAHGLWVREFGASPAVVGKTLQINDVTFTVIGVAARGATDGPVSLPELWLPLATVPILDPDNEFSQKFLFEAGHCCVLLAGRLRDGATRDQAAAELSLLDTQFRQSTGSRTAGLIVTGTAAAWQPGAAKILQVFALILAGLTLLLLVVCANAGNLQLARMMSRQRELTIRQSLGAGRSRIIRQLVTEGLVLGAIAAAASMAAASVLPALAHRAIGEMQAADVGPDTRVLAFLGLLVIIVILGSTLIPAVRSTRRLLTTQHASEQPRVRLRAWFLGAQVALCAMLLVAAALLSRSAMSAASLDLGYAVDDVINVTVFPPAAARSEARLGEIMQAVRLGLRDAGVDNPGEASVAPLSGSRMTLGVRLPGEGREAARRTYTLDVTPGYFEVLRIPIISGRVFASSDDPSAVMINNALAQALWPGVSAIGQTLIGGGDRRVVGVVADAYLSALDHVEPTLFRRETSTAGPAGRRGNLLLRHDPALIARVRSDAASVEPDVIVSVRPLDENVKRALALPRVGAAIAGTIGLLSLLLSAIGVFGVFSYVVAERTREIGIHLALGARRSQVSRFIFRQAAWPLAGGLAAGFGAAWLAAPVLSSVLVGIGAHDASAFVTAGGVIALTAMVAIWHPVRRAAAIDPAVTLRTD